MTGYYDVNWDAKIEKRASELRSQDISLSYEKSSEMAHNELMEERAKAVKKEEEETELAKVNAVWAFDLAQNPPQRTRLEQVLALIKLMAEGGQFNCLVGLRKEENNYSDIFDELNELGFIVKQSGAEKRSFIVSWAQVSVE